jgi:hypothetical protein|nr:MAG TPA: hypothetical protein [Caudoviricetes sp.]
MAKNNNEKTLELKKIDLPQFYEVGNKNINKDDILVDNTKKPKSFFQMLLNFISLNKKKRTKLKTQSEYIVLQKQLSANILRIEEIKLKEKEMIEYNRIDIEELSRENDSISYKLDILKEKIVREDEELNRFEKKLFKSRNK